ncbi:hypothetical protein BATDEDRAFT_33936 [Batrachochytrium dendrobatidis JAM81]|uniref:Uncharacterized protein n=1 Tax=Batrachochytrium dendrobatidis (strain JAM81 / FGSC 10211) TaxID=684364 RepID=F4NSJ6_BATDJ|nr:uncharacterized protein BATDEDRAFT_33936 [Batrachochytrium dendrobatidis JAM81]EGF83832.1 hypothetical protein BATDEDRAFT_33936 [Batrachochytrium dendrobatidis JAM81]|eukprot:XP_006675695.1 hypothetical protein BATDEDRAFT_33936 [Batrachochytrium dendrobatidis JAM81]
MTTLPELPSTTEKNVCTDEKISAELAASISTLTSTSPLPKVKPGDAMEALTTLVADLTAAKKHATPLLKDVQVLAERTWRVNVAYEHRIAQLEREKRQLERLTETVWKRFDELIMPLWRFEDSMVPIYEELCLILNGLESLQTMCNVDASERESRLHGFQDRLHAIENKMVDGKLVPDGRSETSSHIPSGQAMCVQLMERCYRLVRKISDAEPAVDPLLFNYKKLLEDIISNLKSMLDSVSVGNKIDPVELHVYQEQAQAVDSMRKDGKFFDKNGNIPEGQAILHELLEEAFDLIHECMVEYEAQDANDDPFSDVLDTLIDRVFNVRIGLTRYAGTATDSIATISKPALKLMYDVAKEGVVIATDTVAHPQKAALGAYSKLRAVASSTMKFINRIGEELEPIDETLQPQYETLHVIRQTLRKMRNERNRVYLAAQVKPSESEVDVQMKRAKETIAQFNEAYSAQLSEILTDLHKMERSRVDGKFMNDFGEVPSGQVPLSAMLDECFCIAMEMGDETIV